MDLLDGEGYTPLMRAAETGHASTARLLSDRDANVRAVDAGNHSALHLAVMAGGDRLSHYI